MAMSALDLKIPPPLVALACALAMVGVQALVPAAGYVLPGNHLLAAGVAVCGLCVDAAGLWAFRRHRTTVNPLSPHKSSTVVQDGIYRFTRNPMYLGMALLLCAWAVWRSHALAWLLLPCFVAYITRFQIQPEERALLAKFGAPYQAYLGRVRRWL